MSREQESRVWSRARVVKWSRECGRERESRKWVANVSREMESRMGVAKGGRECGRDWESRKEVANVGRENKKKIGAYVIEDPEGSNYLNKKIVRK